nr:hypothetical protein [uncultured Desulfobacter sp.]
MAYQVTHFWDAIYQFMKRVAVLLISASTLLSVPNLPWMADWLQGALGVVLFFPMMFIVAKLISYIDWVPTWLYVNVNLMTPFGVEDSKRLTYYTSASWHRSTYYTFKEVRAFPRERRREVLLKMLNQAPIQELTDMAQRRHRPEEMIQKLKGVFGLKTN